MLQMRGIVWSGFETNTSFFDTLPSPAGGAPLASSTDFSTIVQILYALGFNTIKIPFTFSGLAVSMLHASRPSVLDLRHQHNQTAFQFKLQTSISD